MHLRVTSNFRPIVILNNLWGRTMAIMIYSARARIYLRVLRSCACTRYKPYTYTILSYIDEHGACCVYIFILAFRFVYFYFVVFRRVPQRVRFRIATRFVETEIHVRIHAPIIHSHHNTMTDLVCSLLYIYTYLYMYPYRSR